MKKLKNSLFLLGSLVMLGLALIVVLGNKITVNAATPTAAKVSYRIYDYNANYTTFLANEASFYDDATTVLANAFGPTNTKDKVTEYLNVTTSTHGTEIADAKNSWANDADYGPDCDQTGLAYYGYDIFDLLGANLTDGSFSFRIYCVKKNSFEAQAIVYTYPGAEKTDFKAEEDIVIEPWVTITGAPQVGAQILFDHTGFASSYSINNSSDLFAPSYGDTPVTKKTGIYPTVGWSYDPDSSDGFYSGTPVRAGAVHVKLDSGLSGTYPVSYSTVSTANKSAIQVFVNSDADTYTLTGSSIFNGNETPGTIEIESTGNVTNLKSATINGTKIDKDSTPTITAATSGTPTGISAASSLNIEAIVAGGGTVTSVKFGTTSGSVSNTATDHTSTTGTWDCDISNDSTFVPGSQIYVTIYTKSGDGSQTGSYELIFEKAKLTTTKLENAVITYDGTTVSASEFTFASGTTSYTMNIPTGAEVKVTPTYDQTTNYYQKCYVNGSSTSTANGTAVTIGTTAASFTIVMEAQDGVATKTYTFNLTRISDDVELTKLEYAVTGSSTKNIISCVSKTYTVSSGILYAKSGFTIYPTLKSGQTVTIEDPDNSAAGAVAVTSSGKAYSFVDNPTDVYAATTKTLTMKVKSAFGSVETYTINITRDKADETVTFSTITITYTASGSSKTKSVTTPTAGIYEITGVPYGVTNYTVKVTLDSSKGSLQQWSIDGGTNKLANNATSASLAFSTAKTQVTDSQTITVYAQNRNVTDNYTLHVVRDGADNDTTLTNIVVTYKRADSTTGSITETPTAGNIVVNNVPFLAQTYTITANLSATKASLQKWAIAATAGALPTTPTGTGVKGSGAATSSTSFTTTTATQYDANVTNYVIRVFAQDDTYADYNVTINRDAADTETGITSIAIKIGTTTMNATLDGTSYVVDNVPFKTTQFKVVATLDSAKASIQKYSIDGGTTKLSSTNASANVNFTNQGADGGDVTSASVTVTVFAQNQNVTKDYPLVVNRLEADRNLDLTALTITDNSGTPVGTFNPSTQTFNITVSGKLASTVTSLTASAVLPSGSLSEVYMGTKNSNGSIRIGTAVKTSLVQPFSSTTSADDTFEFEIYVKNELGTTSTPIVASFTRAKTDDTNTITVSALADVDQATPYLPSNPKVLKVDADDPTTPTAYMVRADYETTYITFTIKCSDPTATDTYIYINGATSPLASPYTYKYTFTITKDEILSQRIDVDVYTAAKPYSATPRVASASYTIYVNRDQADADASFAKLDMTDVSGTVQTKGADSSSTKYTYKGIDISTGPFASGKYKIDAEATSTKSTIYWSDTASNLQQHAYATSDEFDVGLYPSGKTIYVTCYSQYGSCTTVEIYTCTQDSRDSDNKVSDVDIIEKTDFEFFATTDYYEVEVPFTVKQVTFKVKKNSLKSTLTYVEDGIQIGGSNQGLNDQYVTIKTNPISSGSFVTCTIQLTAENDSVGTKYTFKVKRLAGQTGAVLETLEINGIDLYGGTNANVLETYTKASTKLDFVMAPTSTSATITFAVSPKAIYTLTNVTTTTDTTDNPYSFAVASGSYTELEFKIQSEKNSIDSPTTFTTVVIKIYSASKDSTLKELDLYKADGTTLAIDVNGDLFAYDNTVLDQGTFTAPYKIGDAVVLDAVATDSNAVITGAGNKSLSAGGTIKYKVLVTSQYAAINTTLSSTLKRTLTSEYVLTVKRNTASSVCTLDSLVVKDTAGNVLDFVDPFTSSNGSYKIENLADSITKVNVSYVLTDTNATITGQTGDQELTLPAGTTSAVEQELTMIVTAEDGKTTKKYTVRLSRTVVQLDGVNDIDNIVVTDSKATSYAPYSSAKNLYEFDIPATEAGVTFNVTTKSSAATLVDAAGTALTNPFVVSLDEGQSKEITIICKAEDGTPGSPYVYKITRLVKDTDATLQSLSYNGIAIADFAPSKINYTINLTHEIDTFYLEAVATKTTSNISTNDAPKDSPVSLIDGINGPYQIIVVAENTLITKVYSVTVIRDADNELSDLKAADTSNNELVDNSGNKLLQYVSTTTTYAFQVPYENAKIKLTATAVGGNLITINTTVDGTAVTTTNGVAEVPLAEGLNEIIMEVIPASGLNKKQYKVNVTRVAGETDNTIKSYQYYKKLEDKTHINETTLELDPIYTSLTVNATDTDYAYYVARDITVFEPKIVANSDKATIIMPDYKVINVGEKNVFEVTVKSQTGVARKYKFTVYNADTDNDILSIKLKESSAGAELVDSDSNKLLVFNKETNTYNISVDYSVKDVYLEALLKSNYATMKYSTNGINYSDFISQKVELSEGDNKFYFYAISEYGKLVNDGATGQTKKFAIIIKRLAADNDPTLKSLIVTIDGVENNWDATLDDGQTLGTNGSYTYVIENIGDTVSTLNIKATANKATTKVAGQLGNQSLNDTAGGSTSGYVFNFTVTSTAEDGSVNTYTVTVSRGALDTDSDNTITGITVVDSLGNSYITFDADTKTYNVTIPYSIGGVKVTSYNIAATKGATSPATINGAGHFNINTTSGDYEKMHYVYATSQKGEDGIKYTINVKVEAPSSECRLDELYIDGEKYLKFSPDTFSYVYGTVENAKKKIDIAAVAKDPLAKITGDIGNDLPLAEGPNYFTIIVTAENGEYIPYKITVTRDASTPVLTKLGATGIDLLDVNDKTTTFSSDVTVYHSIVANKIQNATITASVDNSSYDVTCSNSLPGTTTGLNRSFTVVLNVGENSFDIKVTNLAGKYTTYTYVISRRDEDSSNTSVTSISLVGRENSVEYIGVAEFSDVKNSYDVVVPNKVKNLDLTVQAEDIADAYGPGATVSYINDKNLHAGENTVLALITAENGTTRIISFNVIREDFAFDVEVAEIERFKGDYAASALLAKYNVSSEISSLTINVTNQDPTNLNQPEFVVLKGNELQIGENDVRVRIILDDGTSKYVDFKVERAAYDFEVGIAEIERFKNDYANDTIQRKYVVTSEISELTFEVADKNANAGYAPTYKVVSGMPLQAGKDNSVSVVIIGENGYESDPINLVVEREGYEFELGIKEVPNFKADYTANDYQRKKYTVDSDIDSITFEVKDVNDKAEYTPTYKIISGEKLAIGTNTVQVKIIGEDGYESDPISVTVIRSDYEFEINIKEITRFKNDYAAEDVQRRYPVDSDITSLTFEIKDKNTNATYTPTYKFISGEKLEVGLNAVEIQITGEDGYQPETIKLNVVRADYEYEIGIAEISRFKNDYNNEDLQKKYTVNSDVQALTLNIKDKNDAVNAPTYKFISGETLKIGSNDVVIEITGADGFTKHTVEFTVVRDEYDFSVASTEIADLANDYSAGTLKTKYTVPSKVSTVTDLGITVTNTDPEVETQPTFKVLSGEKLQPGDNTVKIQITAADGSVTEDNINVYRTPMSFEVLENNGVDEGYKCVRKDNSENVYVIDLGKDGKASQITDYTKYIKFNEETDDLVVTKLTDTDREDCNEVMLQVSTKDGAESQIVKIELAASKSPATSFDLYVWIVLGLALILLIIILICVNRDKYGSVSRKRKSN